MALLGVSVLLGAARIECIASAAPRPNILLIVVDDLGYAELGCQGSRDIRTPHMDSLAAGGVRFTSAYVTASYCSPSRAGLLTGRYQQRFGYDVNPVGSCNLDPQAGLPPSELTLAERLRRLGYATGLVGKWHLGASADRHPMAQGFDEFYGFLHEGHFYAAARRPDVISFLRTNRLARPDRARVRMGNVVWSMHMGHNEPAYDRENPILRGRRPVTEEEFLTDAWAREACAFLNRHSHEPFFLYLAYNAPHSPMQAWQPYLERLEHIPDLHRRIFVAMVEHLDASIGRVLRRLGELAIEDRTLVILLSDNGGPTRELTSSNAPFRGGKGTLYEGGIRIPFLIRWPGRLPAGRVYERPIISLDIVPTVLAAVGETPPAAPELDGVDLLPYLTGQKADPPHTRLFWRYGARQAVRDGSWKLVRERDAKGDQLFNLVEDPSESRNLLDEHPGVAGRLRAAWDAWNKQMRPPLRLRQ